MLGRNDYRLIVIVVLALCSSFVSSYIYYNKMELRENGLHFIVMGVAFLLQMFVAGSAKLSKRDELMLVSRGFGAIFVWVSVLVFIVSSMIFN